MACYRSSHHHIRFLWGNLNCWRSSFSRAQKIGNNSCCLQRRNLIHSPSILSRKVILRKICWFWNLKNTVFEIFWPYCALLWVCWNIISFFCIGLSVLTANLKLQFWPFDIDWYFFRLILNHELFWSYNVTNLSDIVVSSRELYEMDLNEVDITALWNVDISVT